MKKAQEEVRRVVRNKAMMDMNDVHQMDYLKCVIKESLRLHPPVPFLVTQETRVSSEVGGFYIPEKTIVLGNQSVALGFSKKGDTLRFFIIPSSIHGKFKGTHMTGTNQRNSLLRDSVIVILISKGRTLNLFRLVLEEVM